MDWSVSQLCHSELSLYVFFNYENDAIIFFIVFLFLQSLENCVCVLHNLTYQLETEMPSLFTKINALASYARNRSSASDAGPIGCFSTQSQKLQQEVCNYTPHYASLQYTMVFKCCGKCAKNMALWMLVFVFNRLVLLCSRAALTILWWRTTILKVPAGSSTLKPCRCTSICWAPVKETPHLRPAVERCRTSRPMTAL